MENQTTRLRQTGNLLIHIQWKGPYTRKDTLKFNTASDFGLYQIYGGHAAYGSGVLLYIGRTTDRPFSIRLGKEHGEFTLNQDEDRLEFYVGRLIGPPPPDDDEWSRRIRLAERLLIYAPQPACNAQMALSSWEEELRNVHVLNWRCHRSLMAEVSGARWTNKYDNVKYGDFFSSDKIPKKLNRTEGSRVDSSPDACGI